MARCTASSSSWSRKGLVRNSTGTRLHGADGHGNIGVTGDKDHWKVHVCLRQLLLEIKTAQVGQADIEDDTTRCIGAFRTQKLARRSKVPSFEVNGMQQSLWRPQRLTRRRPQRQWAEFRSCWTANAGVRRTPEV